MDSDRITGAEMMAGMGITASFHEQLAFNGKIAGVVFSSSHVSSNQESVARKLTTPS
jgi:hypothetical protein